MNNNQFKLNFAKKENKLCNSLKTGVFTVLFEIDTPNENCNLNTVISRYSDFMSVVNEIETFNSGLAITDKRAADKNYNIVDFAVNLFKNEKNRHLIFLSGRESTKTEMNEILAATLNYGINNIVPVSGSVYSDDNLKKLNSVKFTESAFVLEEIYKNRTKYKLMNAGSVINPFKYSLLSIYPQYLKLIRKINYGAEYIIAQAGWDMYKYQELRWYLEQRGLFVPTLARLILLRPEYVESIISGRQPGIFLSPDFVKILRKESKFGLTQFMAAQWRRFQLQIAGLKWFGYSGVVISGLDSAANVKTAALKIKSSFDEFTSFKEWKNSYLNYLSRSDMTPYPYKYYIYDNLFEEAHYDVAKSRSMKIEECSFKEKFNYKFKKCVIMLSDKTKLINRNKAKKIILSGCDGKCNNCCVSSKFMICAKTCPKKMYNGPCGETRDNLKCIASDKVCIYVQVFRYAAWEKDLAYLEER
ncbi:MAG TPA: methylenetetrahydrofolate reductase C-terminal domain-containing protein [Victivallales bacterium]|nr:methylenetetrahydrofolate reductase C-terminal domain-containing protein [Victivallales bacterium]